MLSVYNQLKYLHIYGVALFTIWLGLFLDSTAIADVLSHNQWYTNTLVIIAFGWIYMQVSRVTRRLMLIGVVVAYIGEVILALGFGMYTYRLGNVPLYVPLGHAIVYAAIYYVIREPLVRRKQQRVITLLYPAMLIYSTLWLLLADDLCGFISMLMIIGIFQFFPHTRLFFLPMFFIVVYLELFGTWYQCWQWPEYWFGTVTWMPSANPPSGVGAIYFIFDSSCLLVYSILYRKSWYRFMQLRRPRWQ